MKFSQLKKHSVGFRSVLRQGPTWLIMFVISLRGITCSFYQAPLPEHLVSVGANGKWQTFYGILISQFLGKLISHKIISIS
jgi:hypothetical protein